MIDGIYLFYALIPAALSSIATSIGQGLIGRKALQAIHQQPAASDFIIKNCIIGCAITETAAIMGLVMSLLLTSASEFAADSQYALFGMIGIACAMGISGFCAGIASAFPAVAICGAVARQPFLQPKLLNLMLITQTLIMTPSMFGMLISLMIKSKMMHAQTLTQGLQLLAAGISIGIGCIGPSIGLSLFALAACAAVGVNKQAYGKILTFTIICEAIIETPIIFSLLISLMILSTTIIEALPAQGWQFLAAALCIGLSTISPGINSGRTSATACDQIAKNIQHYVSLSRVTILALAMIDSFAIYGLMISLAILLYV